MFAARLGEHVERLAHHYTEAGLAAPAVRYWLQAGKRATEQSANSLATLYLRRALDLLTCLPPENERDQLKITERRLGVLNPHSSANCARVRPPAAPANSGASVPHY